MGPRRLFCVAWLLSMIAFILLAWPRCWTTTWEDFSDVPLPPLEVVTAIEATELRSRLARNSGILAEHVEEVRRLQLAALKRASRRNVTEDRPPLLQCSSRSFSSMSPYEDWCPSSDGHVEKISSASVVIVKDVCLVKGALVALSPRSATDAHMESKEFRSVVGVKVGVSTQPLILSFASEENHTAQDGRDEINHILDDFVFQFPTQWNPFKIRVGPDITNDFNEKLEYNSVALSRHLSKKYTLLKTAIAQQGNRTAVLMHQSVDNHITHFLESVGILGVGIDSILSDACHSNNLSCVKTIDDIVSLDIHVEPLSWQDHMVRAMLRDTQRKIVLSVRYQMLDQVRCFHKLVVPHFFYGLWPPNEDASGFRKNILSYVQARTEWNIWPLEVLTGRKRRILISTRKTKRTIVDVDNLVEIVRSAASILPFEVTVETIFFGSVSVARQIQASYEADILMSIHGADITNMIFQRKGSALIELFPAFFFEPRFVEMADFLGLHYFAWSCTRPTCAFGGVQLRFETFCEHEGLLYHYGTGTFSTKVHPFTTYRWPYKGFPGYSCTWCSYMACCGELSSAFFGTLRETGIMVGKHKSEITDVLYDAFVALGWMTREEGLAASAALPHARL